MQLLVAGIPCYDGGNATAIFNRIHVKNKKGGTYYEYSGQDTNFKEKQRNITRRIG